MVGAAELKTGAKMSDAACKIGAPELETARRWCVTHNRMMHFCNPDPRSEAGIMKRARELVKEFWRSLPDSRRDIWLLEGPCETLVENVFTALVESRRINEWQPLETTKPPLQTFISGKGWTDKPYVLAVDAKNRMSVGYAQEYDNPADGLNWTFAKPSSTPTHWMPLPDPPQREAR